MKFFIGFSRFLKFNFIKLKLKIVLIFLKKVYILEKFSLLKVLFFFLKKKNLNKNLCFLLIENCKEKNFFIYGEKWRNRKKG